MGWDVEELKNIFAKPCIPKLKDPFENESVVGKSGVSAFLKEIKGEKFLS